MTARRRATSRTVSGCRWYTAAWRAAELRPGVAAGEMQESMSMACERCGTRYPKGCCGCPACVLEFGMSGYPDAAGEPAERGGEAPELCGDYELLGEIARGGMGVVCRARQRSLNRIVAVKRILNGRWANAADAGRFRLEAEAAARLEHPSIVPIYDIGEQDGLPYFSMKLVEGGNLAEALAAGDPRFVRSPNPGASTAERRAWQERIARLMIAVSQAVHFAHEHGVLHRDLKPTNILIGTGGEPYLTDFGLAKLFDRGTGLTRSTAVLGTPAYMSPEQASGRLREVTVASDVYSLGAILYELLTGRPPFTGESPLEILDQVRVGTVAAVRSWRPEVDPDLETVCLKCLHPEPSGRYASAGALADDLVRWEGSRPIEARRTGLTERFQLWSRRNPFGAVAVGLLVAVTAISTFAAVRLRSQRDEIRGHLARSVVSQAKAQRLGAAPDRGRENVRLLSASAALGPTLEARNEAIAALALPGLASPQTWLPAKSQRFQHQRMLSANGERFAVFGQERGITVYRRRDGLVVAELATPPGHVFAGALSPDGRRLVNFDAARTAFVWDLDAATPTNGPPLDPRLIIPGPWIHQAEFAQDGQALVLAGLNRQLRFHSVADGREIRRVELPMVPSRLALAPADGRIAVASGDTVLVWDVAVGSPRSNYVHASVVTAMAWHPAGRHLALGFEDGDVHLLDTTGGGARRLASHRQYVNGLAFGAAGEVLASSSWDSTHRHSDTATGHVLFETADAGPVQSVEDGRWFVLVADDGGIRARELVRSPVFRAYSNPAGGWPGFSGVDFSADGRRIASGDAGGLHVWDVADGRETAYVATPAGIHPRFDPGGRTLVTSGRDRLERWVFELGETGRDQLSGPEVWYATAGENFAHPVFSPDGRWLAVGGRLSSYIFRWGSRERPVLLRDHRQVPGHDQVLIDPSGNWAVGAAFGGGGVTVWSTREGTLVRRLIENDNAVVSLSPDGKTLATGTAGELVLWDTTNWTPRLRRRTGLAGGVPLPVEFSPDGSLLAFAGSRQSIDLIRPADGAIVASLAAPIPLNLVALRFSRDGRHLGAQTLGPLLEVWNLAALRGELRRLALDW